MPAYTPRRSVLYMPGANTRALEKAAQLDTDALIFDLEDAVSPEQKVVARQTIKAAFEQHDYAYRTRVVRVNSLTSQWGVDDLRYFANSADAIAVPKVESAGDVKAVLDLLAQFGDVQTPIWAMIETPRGVLNALAIAESDPRLQVLIMGTNDLSKDLRVPQNLDRAAFMTSFGLCILAARAAGKEIIDGVYIHLDDAEGFQFACAQGRDLGFDGKTLIHPKQLEVCNQSYSPSPKQVAEAEQLVKVWQNAQAQGLGVLVHQGRLVEELHVIDAQRVLDIHRSITNR